MSTKTTPTVPTVRYRVLAIVFFLLAVGGLFLGALGQVTNLFTHSNAVLYQPNEGGLALGAGTTLLSGTLFAYLYDMLVYFFTPGNLVFAGQTIGFIVNELLGLAQVLFLAGTVVASLALAIAACVCKKSGSRNCAMVSGYLVATAYLWPILTLMFFAADPATQLVTTLPSIEISLLGNTIMIAYDLPLLIIFGVTFLILAITAIARRKWVGFFNVFTFVLLVVATFALIYPTTSSYASLHDVVWGVNATTFITPAYIALAALLGVCLVLAIWRLNAKRCYPFQTVMYGLLFLVVVALDLSIIIKAGNWELFTATPVYTSLVLGATLLAFLFSLFATLLVVRRRRALRARRIAEELADEDKADEEEPAEDEEIAEQPAEAEQPAAQPQPAYQAPYPYPYATPSAAAYQAAAQSYGQTPYQQMPYQQAPAAQQQSPVVVQAPATPPVIVVQLPPYYPQAAAPVAPVAPVVPAEQPVLTSFEQRMVDLARPNTAPAAPAVNSSTTKPVQPVYHSAPVAGSASSSSDPFLATLTNEQKNEFCALFVEHVRGDFNLPTYAIGGDNAVFFSRVFASLGKFRPYISSDLLAKLYDYSRR